MSLIISSDNILGKEAVDPQGQIMGVISELLIDKASKEIIGITVDMGFMKPDLFVGMDYISNFGIDSIFLSKIPPDKYRGLKVYTEKGKKIGIVEGAQINKTELKQLVVSSTTFSFNKKKVLIPLSQIKEISSNVIVREDFKKIN